MISINGQYATVRDALFDALAALFITYSSTLAIGPQDKATRDRASSASKEHTSRTISRTTSSSDRRSSRACLMLLLIIATLPALAESATFFYGATDLEGHQTPSSFESVPLSLNEEEMDSVYRFCLFLPKLELAGKVRRNDQTREICDKLLEMLQPMYERKRVRAARMST
ncbi:hypothetical protein AAVH_01661 [Aphelenchoides avenae]|nr:hypothetical protein AAVH_01661 [Aphelenchus avenae]